MTGTLLTSLTSAPSILPKVRFGLEPRFTAAGLVIAMSLAVTVPAMLLDARLFQGESIWIKPIKFQVALMVYLLTLAFFARFLPDGMTDRPLYKLFAGVVVFAIFAELAWIGWAAMFGTASHFNTTIPFMVAIYPVMGVLAIILTAASLVYGIAIWRNPAGIANPALRLSVALGLILTFVLTVVVAGVLAGKTGHLMGTPEFGVKVPLMGWSREVGDLRVAHFFATHAMHFLPIVGIATLALTRRGKLALGIVWGASVGYAAFAGFTFWQALNGQPFLPV